MESTFNNTCNSNNLLPGSREAQTNRHPCYSAGAHHKYARMHLPVAPKCNLSCNYCNRKFDCLHESRPGVTSEILTPLEAERKFRIVKERIANLSVIGIAGPGDALANWEATKESIERIKASDPQIIVCLSTNGLMLPQYAQAILNLGIRHVTVTLNCLDPEIGSKIYDYVLYKGKSYEGKAGASLLINNQLEGIRLLAAGGVLVKVNIVMIKGINDHHISEVVKKAKELGAFMTNIMPLIPAQGSAFEGYPQTSMKELNNMRNLCQLDLHQMRHCKQCRADAIGLLGEDRSIEFRGMGAVERPERSDSKEYRIAVTSKRGDIIDQHFGHAAEFIIYKGKGSTFQRLETRQVEKYCNGTEFCDTEEGRRERIIGTLADCDVVLTMRIGFHAKQRLLNKGILPVEHYDTVEKGLIYALQELENKEAV